MSHLSTSDQQSDARFGLDVAVATSLSLRVTSHHVSVCPVPTVKAK